MRVEVTVLTSTFLLGTAPVTLAQNLNDNQLPAIAQETKTERQSWLGGRRKQQNRSTS